MKIDAKAHIYRMKKILLKKWDPGKSKTKQTDIRNKENKKRSRTEEASTGTNKSNGNDKSKRNQLGMDTLFGKVESNLTPLRGMSGKLRKDNSYSFLTGSKKNRGQCQQRC